MVIVTGYPHSEVMEKAMKYGPFTVIKKPVMINDVLSVVRSAAWGGNQKMSKGIILTSSSA